ncbi:MAG: putative signal transducing protein [Myxococcota bacterium]
MHMVRVYSNLHPIHAYLVRSALREAGVHAEVRGEHLAGLGGPPTFAEVWVPVGQQAAAIRVLGALEEDLADDADDG